LQKKNGKLVFFETGLKSDFE